MKPARSSSAGFAVAFAILILGLMAAFTLGRYPLTLAEIAHALIARLTGQPSSLGATVDVVVWNVRAPRVAAAVLVGMGLAVAGAAFQGLFRNPLVSPDILGASSGAALGAVLGIYLSLDVVSIQLLAFAGGLAAVAVVYLVSASFRVDDVVLTLVLMGIVVGSLLGAGIGLIKYLADPYNQLPAMTFWLLGSLAGIAPGDLAVMAGPIALGTAALLLLRWQFDAMSLPEDEARALGVPTTALRIAVVLAATLMTSSAVAAAGVIGWVGLVVPHIARFLVGPSFHRLLPASALLGGGFVLLVDTTARSAASVEVPLGILTALVGAPVFIWVFARARKIWS